MRTTMLMFTLAIAASLWGCPKGSQPGGPSDTPPSPAKVTAPGSSTAGATGQRGVPEADAAGSVAEGIQWVSDLDQAVRSAAAEKKPVMVDFYTDWCSWCKKLDSDTYTDTEVQKLAARFVNAKVDAEADRAAAEKYQVDGFPTIVFLSPDGEEIHRIGGYAPPEKFLKEMQTALDKVKQGS
ncbi:MAG TPA: thioredoxin family protein [Armatimonadota bacterium]|nr:thioredoxin family protein [Armatimonadota bacterium]